ncbi:MAG TPA: arginase family protein [Ruminiclostridium sp.]
MQNIIKKVKDIIGDTKVFLTFDIDFLDPSCAPGTGTPAIGGFSTAQALELIRGMKDLNVVGYDLVEVNPQYDVGSITSLAAATIMYEFVSQIAYRKKMKL